MEPIIVDGAFGEGGGQIIRTSVSLAALTGRPLEIINIRARRSKPGLQAQHLTAVRAAAALCNAELRGAELGSVYLRFTPGPLVTQSAFAFDIGTAGATGLVAQTLLVPMTRLPAEDVTADITGGTHVPMAPTSDYIIHVYAPLLQRLGHPIQARSERAGFFPKGGGDLRLRVLPGSPGATLDLTERGRLLRLQLCVTTALLPGHVAERAVDTLLKELKGYGVPVVPAPRDLPSNGPGAAVVIVAECENGLAGFTGLGERGKPMERVAMEAARGFQKWYASNAATDEHLADQLILPCALTPGEHRWTTPEITDHLRTVCFVAQEFLPIDYSLEEQADGTGLVTVRGASLAQPPEAVRRGNL